MAGRACVVFDKTLTDYDFGPSHPMSPLRVDLTMRLAESLGVVGGPGSTLGTVSAPIATDEQVATVHTAAFGAGPLIGAGMPISRLYTIGAAVALLMGLLSFAVAHRRPAPAQA